MCHQYKKINCIHTHNFKEPVVKQEGVTLNHRLKQNSYGQRERRSLYPESQHSQLSNGKALFLTKIKRVMVKQERAFPTHNPKQPWINRKETPLPRLANSSRTKIDYLPEFQTVSHQRERTFPCPELQTAIDKTGGTSDRYFLCDHWLFVLLGKGISIPRIAKRQWSSRRYNHLHAQNVRTRRRLPYTAS